MPSTYSSRLRFELIGAGEQSGTWGTTTNTNLGTLIEQAIAGVAAVAMTDANYTLTTANGSTDEARQAVLQITGTLTAARNVTCPTSSKVYLVYNNTTGGFAITLKTAAGTGISVPNGKKMFLYCDGTNVVDAISELPAGTQVGGSDIVTLSASQTLTNKVLTSPSISSPTITGTLTCSDSVFQLQDNSDATKKLAFELSSITTATTRTLTVPNASDTIVVASGTQTLANKTLDNTTTLTVKDANLTIQDDADATKQAKFQASGITTGNTRTYTLPDVTGTLLHTTGVGSSLTGIRIQGKETIWVPAAAMYGSTTNGATPSTTETATNLVMIKGMDFADGATTLKAQFAIQMPKSWNLGTITWQAIWTANSSSTNSVVWQLRAMALSDTNAIDTAFGTATTVTDANGSSAYTARIAAESGATTVGNTPAAGDWVAFEIFRDPTNGSDTLAATATLLGVRIFYTTNASDDT